MIDNAKIISLRMERQHLINKAEVDDYLPLYRDMQPGQNVYWNGFGDPPSLTYRADFDDIEFNRKRQNSRDLLKGRFAGGNLGWITYKDIELFTSLYCKPLKKPSERQLALLELINREGPLNIQQMKDSTGMLVKEITPALHRLQEAFLIYEDQYDGEWDRGWYKFSESFPKVNLEKYTRVDALKIVITRFAYRHVLFDIKMVRSFYKASEKDIKAAVTELIRENVLCEIDDNFILCTDFKLLKNYDGEVLESVYAMHRNDFLVKSVEHILKEKYQHSYPDTLYYLLIDSEFCGAVVGKFRYTPDVEDIILDLPKEQCENRKEEILKAVHALCGENTLIKRYMGKDL